MPELPEAETIARDLDAALRGAVVRSVRVRRPDVLRGVGAAAFERALEGARIERVWRRAKSVVVDLATARRSAGAAAPDARRLVVTPRFTGTVLLDAEPDAYTCLTITLTDGRTAAYRDVRRLGTLSLLVPAAFAAWEAGLGPEPLDPALTAERLSGMFRASKRPVKSLLMDQRRLAGVGNIYANEACWRAGVRPARRGRTITAREAAALLGAVRAVLTESIARRGTTFRDYRDAHGARGGFAARLAVYGRGGEPCRRCGAPLAESQAIDRRRTVWCRSCQR